MASEIEITTMSSRGQIVIPEQVRENLHLQEGEKFAVAGKGDTIVLKKLKMPSFEGFDKLLKETQEFAKKKGIKESDVKEAIKRTRNR